MQKCPACRSTPTETRGHSQRDIVHIDCPVCGAFWITPEAAGWVAHESFGDERRRRLVGQLRNADRRGVKLELLSSNVGEIADAAIVPRSPVDLMDRVLMDFAAASKSFASQVAVHPDEHYSLFLPTVADLHAVLGYIEDEGLIKNIGRSGDMWTGRMEVAGWKRVRELESSIPRSWSAFVAMSFAEELKPAWVDGIKPALESTGYQPIRVDEVEHLGKIDDRIVAELRQASLVVADFTLHRAGVYFEAGFAMGRGIPVIWSCRLDDVGNAHFDTRQYNHITWETPSELRDKLVNRIRATMPAKAKEM